MKLLPKITIMLVAILSCCSCSKGKKVSKEEFLEKIKEIKTNDSYKIAKVEATFIEESGYEYNVQQHVNNSVSVSVEKDVDGKWEYKGENSEFVEKYYIDSVLNKNNLDKDLGFLEKYSTDKYTTNEEFFIEPFAYNFVEISKEEIWPNDKTYTTHIEWNKSGYVTCYFVTYRSSTRFEEIGFVNFFFSKYTVKITYE